MDEAVGIGRGERVDAAEEGGKVVSLCGAGRPGI